MHILFIDDEPEYKIQDSIRFLESRNFDFTYDIVQSVSSARQYIAEHSAKIDLAVVDLGMTLFDKEDSAYEGLYGLLIVEALFNANPAIPMIINSMTDIPNESEYLEQYTSKGTVIRHIFQIHGEWLLEFIEKHVKKY